MATLTLKNVPDDLYARLKARAAEHDRSLNREVLHMLEQELSREAAIDPAQLRARLRRSRAALEGVWVTDADIASARARTRKTT